MASPNSASTADRDPGRRADWDQARQAWNLAADPHPTAVAFVESAADVAKVLRFCADHGLRALGQGTGHGAVAVGSLDDTVVIKTERLRGIEIDPDASTARVEAGVLALELGEATAAHGHVLAAGLVARRGCHRLHARRRSQLAGAPPRLRLQPGAGNRARDRRRRAAHRRREQRAGPLLGASRRGRRLRDRRRDARRPAPPRRGLRRGAGLPGRGRHRGRADLPRLDSDRPRRDDVDRPLPAPAAASRRAGAHPRQAAADGRWGVHRRRGRRRAPDRAAARDRRADHGHVRADAGRRAQPDPHGSRGAGRRASATTRWSRSSPTMRSTPSTASSARRPARRCCSPSSATSAARSGGRA